MKSVGSNPNLGGYDHCGKKPLHVSFVWSGRQITDQYWLCLGNTVRVTGHCYANEIPSRRQTNLVCAKEQQGGKLPSFHWLYTVVIKFKVIQLTRNSDIHGQTNIEKTMYIGLSFVRSYKILQSNLTRTVCIFRSWFNSVTVPSRTHLYVFVVTWFCNVTRHSLQFLVFP